MGQSGLSGLHGSHVIPCFHASLIFFTKRKPQAFLFVLNFCSNPGLHPLHPLHPIIINYLYFALVAQTLLM